MGGIARELWFDNLATAVAEHDGNLVRFHPRFWPSLANMASFPALVWCERRGKRKNRGSHRLYQNQLLATAHVHRFSRHQLASAQWLNEVANQRRHRETGQTPAERLQLEALALLAVITPTIATPLSPVHKNLRLSFDGNRYAVPPRYVGRISRSKRIAPRSPSTITAGNRPYPRCWRRGQVYGADAFKKNCSNSGPRLSNPRHNSA